VTLSYPFGTPLTPRPPSADGPRKVFILGAYPSALHVRWTPPPNAGKPIAAIPIADEPSPFWDGADAVERIARWVAALGDTVGACGRFSVPANLNGPSGQWVDDNVLQPLGVTRDKAWITDCLDTYRMSTGVAKRLDDTYANGVRGLGWPNYNIGSHPSETDIVREALELHADRLRSELSSCQPEVIVTLGNAAARVITALLGDGPRKLKLDGYGARLHPTVEGRMLEWIPLAHPAAPKQYQEAHKAWMP